jgi:4-hydroxy 2-oxovalerate aldolase
MSEIEIDSIDEMLGDSAGALVLADAQARVQALLDELAAQAQVGFHEHQNLSLGVANSVLAVQAGARQIDGALCALGAGAGNAPYRGARGNF